MRRNPHKQADLANRLGQDRKRRGAFLNRESEVRILPGARSGTGPPYVRRVEMIIRKDQPPGVHAEEEATQYYGPSESLRLSEEGG
jgi:hypothetical protein